VLSRLQKRKVVDLFYLLDQDRDGAVHWSDLDRIGSYVCLARGWSRDDDPARGLRTAHRLFWQSLLWSIGTTDEGGLRLDAWETHVERMHRAFQEGKRDVAARCADAWFQLLDADGDGVVGREDYRAWLLALGSSANADAAFDRLDADDDGVLDRGEVRLRWAEWIMADDADALGNVLATGRLSG